MAAETEAVHRTALQLLVVAFFVSILEKLQCFFGTAKWRRAETRRVAQTYFAAFDPRAAEIVIDNLQDELGINFDQLKPETDLAADLGADEDEPLCIAMRLKEFHQLDITEQQVIDAKTVGSLVRLVSELLAAK